MIASLIIDDGVPSRGHRANVFNPEFRVVGIGIGPHARYSQIVAMDMAGGFVNKPKAEQEAIHLETVSLFYYYCNYYFYRKHCSMDFYLDLSWLIFRSRLACSNHRDSAR